MKLTPAQKQGKDISFMTLSISPFAGEPRKDKIVGQFITPVEHHFARNLANIPVIPQDYRLEVSGLVSNPLSLSIQDLKEKFAQVEVIATMQSAGNRRKEFVDHITHIHGEIHWGAQTIGNAKWTGVRLKDVLAAAQILPKPKKEEQSEEQSEAESEAESEGKIKRSCLDPFPEYQTGETDERMYVCSTSLELVVKKGGGRGKENYGSCLPLKKAISDEVILAYEMNGRPLLPTHGFPLRLIVPGFVSEYSIKWISKLEVTAEPSKSYFFNSFKLLPWTKDTRNANWDDGIPISENNVNSMIYSHSEGDVINSGPDTLKGVALSGGGRAIRKVEVSVDGGSTWITADLEENANPFAWTLWSVTLEVAPGKHQFVCRAYDSACNSQPESLQSVLNLRGFMNNSWFRANVTAIIRSSL
eukprot:TRINITY_DN2029_c3_g1_i1.p1 TRINITY_DN2029_c3_g1~~TRINITY_DN2029_c3_g1_i1.p1  ORF type:complete len:416 (-),score=135.56 TRINITY_DN2029_c3_g1_i1:24-1271(-)